MIVAIYTSKLMIDDPVVFVQKTGFKFLYTLCGLAMYSYFVNKVSNDFIEEFHAKLHGKELYKFILDRLEHSIVIIQDDQIEFINDRFLN